MIARPEISVCIANYNGVGIIDKCLLSVLSQKNAPSYEIIIHDDASQDDSARYIEEHYPTVHLIKSQTNVGFCISNNRMVNEANGKYILLLNNDATLFPDALNTLFFYEKIEDNHTILTLPQYDAESSELLDCGCWLDIFFNPVPNLELKQQDVAMAIGACLFISKKFWVTLGGFPENFGSIAEDMWLCLLARLTGGSVIALPSSGYYHLVGHSFGGGKAIQGKLSSTLQRRALSERNKTMVLIATQPSALWFPLLALHLLMLFLEGVILTIAKRNMEPWHKIYAPLFTHLWTTRQQQLKQRKLVQSLRRCSLYRWWKVFVIIPRKITMFIKYGLPTLRK